jgi:LuxR family maltose regulon positive regulatory protein
MTTPSVIRTSLYPPVSRAALIERGRLLDLLEQNRDRRLTVVAAPAGFGKTTILGQWFERLRREGMQCCWCSLDRDDDQPPRFLRHVVSALRTQADIGRDVLLQLDATLLTDIASTLPALIDDLADMEREIVLFVDDYHHVRSADIHRYVELLTDLAPTNLRIVLASRLRPQLALSSLRMRRQVCEINAYQLRFDIDETRDFMQRTVGLDLSAPQLERLYEHSEGWAAGLQLASLSLHDASRRDALIGSFSGSLRDIADYLAGDVLNQQEPEIREFLLRTAILDRISASSAAAVTQRPDARALLEGIEARNLFLVPLDASNEWYRYHHLFQEFLLAELRRAFPDEIVALYRRASDWFAGAGLRNEAVNYALLSGDMLKVGRLVHDGTLENLAMDGKMTELLSWVSGIPQSVKIRFPRLLIQECIALSHLCRSSAAAAVADQATAAIERLPQVTDFPYTPADIERLRQEASVLPGMVAFCKDDIQDAAAASLHNLQSTDDLVLAIANNFIGYAALLRHDLPEAERYFARGRFHHVTKGTYYGAVISDCLLVSCDLLRLRLDAAYEHARNAERLVDNISGGHVPGLAKAKVMQAAVLYEWDRIEEARELLDEHLYKVEAAGQASIGQAGFLTLARCLFASGRSAAARQALDRCLQISQHANHEYIELVVEIEKNRMAWLADGAVVKSPEAHALRAPIRALAADWNRSTFARLYLQIQSAIHAGHYEGFATPLRDLRTLCRARGLAHPEIQLTLLSALAHEQRGEREASCERVREALALVGQENALRRFLDAGPLIVAPLLDVTQRNGLNGNYAQRDFLTRLLAASRERGIAPGRARPGATGNGNGLIEALSSRELQILGWIARGDSNAVIGAHLLISENTVKWHIKNVFAKLGVNNRTAAVIAAQQHQLLA